MSDVEGKSISSAEIPILARAARLNLKSERSEVVAPALDGMLQLIDLLDEVDIGETPPTNSFNAQWRDPA